MAALKTQEKQPKILFFFPHNPYPPKSGAHKRCLEILAGLKELGCAVTLLSSTLSSETQWDSSSIQHLEENLVKEVRVYQPSALDYWFLKVLGKYHYILKTRPSVDSAFFTPPGMRFWFRRIFAEVVPNSVIINYVYWDGLLNQHKSKSLLRIIDIHDLITLNNKMQSVLSQYLSPLNSVDTIEKNVLEENFYEKFNLTVSPKEFRIFDKYDYTIAITSKEVGLLEKNTSKTKVILIPVTHEPCYIKNNYTGRALFTIGPNPFNIQGYIYFVQKVLPLVKQKVPSFSLEVTGAFCDYEIFKHTEGVTLSGFVPNLVNVYELAKFLICPVFGGTGQQIKIVEAMAHGLPVIALRFAAERSPISHGVNGFVADNAEEFADYVIQLWNDKELCCQLGNAARNTISAEFSRTQLLEGLSLIFKP